MDGHLLADRREVVNSLVIQMTDLLQQLQKVSVLAFLVGSMLGTGLNLTIQSVLAPLRDFRLVLTALGLNFVFAPVFAWLLTVVIPLESGHAIGLLLLGGAAGAPFLPKLAETAGCNLTIAASLMVLLTVGTILFMPFALPLMIPGFQEDPWSIARPLLLLILLPFAAGIAVKSRASAFAARAAPVCTKVGNISLLLLFVLLIALNIPALLGVIGSGAILAAILYIAGLFAAGWLLGGSQSEARRVVALGTAARNFGTALVPAANCFSDPKVTIMLIVSAIISLIALFLAAGWMRKARFA